MNSTRWRNHTKRPLVENTIYLDAAALCAMPRFLNAQGTYRTEFAGASMLEPSVFAIVGLSPVQDPTTDEYRVFVCLQGPGWPTFTVTLAHRPMGFANHWCWSCPTDCGRWVRRLYVSPGLDRLACRVCFGLSYRSTQTWDSRIPRILRALRHGDEALVDRLIADTGRLGYRGYAASLLYFRVWDALQGRSR